MRASQRRQRGAVRLLRVETHKCKCSSGKVLPAEVPAAVLVGECALLELGSQGQGIARVDVCRFRSFRLSCGKPGDIVQKLGLRARASTRGARAALGMWRARRAPLR